jgi:peptide/nickel transport system substrate-binding protein
MKRFLLIIILAVLSAVITVSDVFSQQKTPIRGGVLREIWASGPACLSYFPEMGPSDERAVLPATERLMDYDQNKQLVPFLAESVTVAKDRKSILFKLRKGIKFHDGSDLNAEAVAWNYQMYKDAKKLQYNARLVGVDVVDPYTVRLRITGFTGTLLHSFGWAPIFSKQAWDKAGDGNADKSKEWARANIVGTGPFKLAEYKRDNYVKWVRNENYWQKGKPHIDGIYVRIIPDPVTASAMMQTKEADFWGQTPVKDQSELEKKGLVRQSGFGLPRVLLMNLKDQNSKFQNKKLREAVEYAIDKPAIAKALGFGYYVPLTMMAPPGEWGFDPAYVGRPYDPARAKQLLAEAGYPNGVSIQMMAMTMPAWPEEATAIKSYLDAVGIKVEIDLADPGRFYGALWQKGWPDMALSFTGMDVNYLVQFHRMFGPEPMTNFASFVRPPSLVTLGEQSLAVLDEKGQKEITKQLVRAMADDALVIPLYRAPNAYMVQPWVHTSFLSESNVTRRFYDEWMDKH